VSIVCGVTVCQMVTLAPNIVRQRIGCGVRMPNFRTNYCPTRCACCGTIAATPLRTQETDNIRKARQDRDSGDGTTGTLADRGDESGNRVGDRGGGGGGDFATFTARPCRSAEDFSAAGSTADGIGAGNEPYPCRILAERARVKVISRPAVGYDQLDVAATTAAGIAVAHVPDYCTDAVADHALPSCWPSIVGYRDAWADRGDARCDRARAVPAG